MLVPGVIVGTICMETAHYVSSAIRLESLGSFVHAQGKHVNNAHLKVRGHPWVLVSFPLCLRRGLLLFTGKLLHLQSPQRHTGIIDT